MTDRIILKLRGPDGVDIDLFPAWVAEGQVFVFPHTVGALSVDQVLPLRPCPVTGYPVPQDPEAMLEVNYGADWRVPDPLFKFDWPGAYQAFARFLAPLR